MSKRNLGVIAKLRRNHGIEHATAHVLQEWDPQITLAGLADPTGFSLIGDIETERLERAVKQALERMKKGEAHLAVHPRCGTQLVTLGALTALAALLSQGRRPQLKRLPDVIVATTLAAVVAQPIGLALQKYGTTSPDVQNARLARITKSDLGGVTYHHVDISWDASAEASADELAEPAGLLS